MITPSAVPPAAVAIGPVLQCVRILALLRNQLRPGIGDRRIDCDLFAMNRPRLREHFLPVVSS